jgi:hypothetical protein
MENNIKAIELTSEDMGKVIEFLESLLDEPTPTKPEDMPSKQEFPDLEALNRLARASAVLVDFCENEKSCERCILELKGKCSIGTPEEWGINTMGVDDIV